MIYFWTFYEKTVDSQYLISYTNLRKIYNAPSLKLLIPNVQVESVEIEEQSCIIYVGVGIGNLHLYKSTNFGEDWEYISQDIPTNNLPYSLYALDNLILCGTSLGVYKSTNYGNTWDSLNTIPGTALSLLIVNNY